MRSRSKKLLFGAFAVAVIAFVFFVISRDTDASWWSGLWDKDAGVIISTIVAFIILFFQQLSNHINNRKNRKLQVEGIINAQEQKRVDDLRQNLIDYVQAFDFDEVENICDRLVARNYNQDDFEHLKHLVRDISEKALVLKMSIDDLEKSEYRDHFINLDKFINKYYKCFLNDLCEYFKMMKSVPSDTNKAFELIEIQIKYCIIQHNFDERQEKVMYHGISKSYRSLFDYLGSKITKEEDIEEIPNVLFDYKLIVFQGENSYREKLYKDIRLLVNETQNKVNQGLQESI